MPKHPEDGGVRAGEGVHQQEAQGEAGRAGSRSRRHLDPETHAGATAAAVPVAPVGPVRSSARSQTARCRRPSRWPRGSPAGDRDALATLQLGEPADLVAMLPGVLAGIDPLRLEIRGRRPEDLGEVGPDPLLAGL